MAVELNELQSRINRLHSIKQRIMLISSDIRFLKTCRGSNIYPDFMHINISIKNSITKKVINQAKLNWIHLEIKEHYAKRNRLSLEAYELHLEIVSNKVYISHAPHNSDFNLLQERFNKMQDVIMHKFDSKNKRIDKKLTKLKQEQYKDVTPKQTDHDQMKYVINLSNEQFTTDELAVLNKGFKLGIRAPSEDLKQLMVDVETSIKSLNYSEKSEIRSKIKNSLKKTVESNKCTTRNNIKQSSIINKQQQLTIKNLTKKNAYYTKADKSNTIVILDKADYNQRVNDMIKDGPYVELKKSPLQDSIKDVNKTLCECRTTINDQLRRNLKISNPTIPRMYCLPKIHKAGKNMRPIVSGINAPTYRIAKWLVSEFSKLPQNNTHCIGNNLELISVLQKENIEIGEIMVSFDVTALYPSIQLNKCMTILKKWLIWCKLSTETIEEYLKLTELCMRQNSFRFNNKFFKQIDGTAMGNPLSGFLANLFMNDLETTASNTFEYFPRVWKRYVDDVFAVFDTKYNLEKFHLRLNHLSPTIKFTYEIEDKGVLPFLDIRIIRKNSKFEFDIYRKKTHTDRYITSDSHHTFQHKNAAFNSMIHRLNTFPLEPDAYEKELQYIKNIAASNGYNEILVDNINKKHRNKVAKQMKTTLTPIEKSETKKWSKITYHPPFSNKIKNILKEHEFKVTVKTNKTLKNVLHNTKDKVEMQDKSGVYEITCNDCPTTSKYLGQTRRKVQTRVLEHARYTKHKQPEKSAVAEHILETGHSFENTTYRLLKSVNKLQELDVWESYFIQNSKDLINREPGPITSPLLDVNFINKLLK